MNKLSTFFFLLIFSSFFSQNYQPIDTMQAAFISNLTGKLEFEKKKSLEELEQNKIYTSKEKKLVNKLYTEFYDDEVKDTKKGYFFMQPLLSDYIQQIVNEITVKNPEIEGKELKFYYSRENIPNAKTSIKGNIFFNFVFLKYIDSEAELAAILAHEIGHYHLKHSEKAIDSYVKNKLSKEVKDEEARIKSLEYNKSSAAEELLKKIIYNKNKINRGEEIKADSISLEFLKNTKYGNSSILSLLEKLDKIDVEKDSLTEDDFRKYFTIPNYKFNEDWLEIEDISAYNFKKEHYFKWDVDSLKTHPSCSERINLIKGKTEKHSSDEFSFNKKLFDELKLQAEFEEVRSLYFLKEFGLSFYKALILHKKYPNSQYPLKMIASNLEMLKKAKVNKNYGKYILQINPFDQTRSLQLFYSFFDNIASADLAAFEQYYKTKTTNN